MLRETGKAHSFYCFVGRWSDYDQARWHDVSTVDGKRVRMVDGILIDGAKWLDVVGINTNKQIDGGYNLRNP